VPRATRAGRSVPSEKSGSPGGCPSLGHVLHSSARGVLNPDSTDSCQQALSGGPPNQLLLVISGGSNVDGQLTLPGRESFCRPDLRAGAAGSAQETAAGKEIAVGLGLPRR
jgi:hypothetical protein